jgi:hypothetical protein
MEGRMARSKIPDDTQTLPRRAWKVAEWGRLLYGFGHSKSYQLVRSGEGPRVVVIGGEQYITEEADAEWRRSLAEQAA